MIDYYELMQISAHADSETIPRVYRFLAARFHPDNPQSGDVNQFHLLHRAYETLSDPALRAEYDATLQRQHSEVEPFASTVDFMDSLDGELNRRLAVLAVLYRRRRATADQPQVSLVEIEEKMGFPRDYLDFTLWYLSKKAYITRADNAAFALTAEGVDFVEKERLKIPALSKMLTHVQEASASADEMPHAHRLPPRAGKQPIVLPSEARSEDCSLVIQHNVVT